MLLNRKDCANIGQQFRTGILDVRKFMPSHTLSEDWERATAFLLEKGYFCETIQTTGQTSETTHALVFAHPNRLNILASRGFLTLFDSTHKFNIHNYNLFTFMCRNEAAIWVPGAHCLVERENSDILALALRTIYEWTNKSWKMQYPLTDNSAIEKAAVRKAFDTEDHSFVKCHLLCTVHSERTLARRFRSEDSKVAYGYMRHAIRVNTEAACIDLCKKAINACESTADKRYIEREWLETRRSWAMFARQHNQLLLQATSSNACEAWHARLKLGSGLKTGETATHGIFGCVRTVHDCAHDIDNKTLAASLDSHSRHSSLSKSYPSLRQFPFAIQKIIAIEESKVGTRIEQDMPVPVREKINGIYICYCLFSRRYQLPCQHIFHMDRSSSCDLENPVQLLTSDVWNQYHMLVSGGMESYEAGLGGGSIAHTIARPDDNKTLRVLKLTEVNERIRSTFYSLDEKDPQRSTDFVEGIQNLISTILSLPEHRALPISVPPHTPTDGFGLSIRVLTP